MPPTAATGRQRVREHTTSSVATLIVSEESRIGRESIEVRPEAARAVGRPGVLLYRRQVIRERLNTADAERRNVAGAVVRRAA